MIPPKLLNLMRNKHNTPHSTPVVKYKPNNNLKNDTVSFQITTAVIYWSDILHINHKIN